MTDGHLGAIEAWARNRDDKHAGMVILALCAEVRRLRGYPAAVPVESSESPYRGILHQMTAADVYGVEE
jgi:hypothetical protein